MKRRQSLLLSGLLMSCSLQSAQAAGLLLIDPGLTGPIAPPRGASFPPRNMIVRPPGGINIWPHPHPPATTTTPLLNGRVSFGLHLKSQAVKVQIDNQVARTYIKQEFSNDTDRNLSGTYLFPLPPDTTFSSFSLHIDGKPVEGKILLAEEARQQYEAIVRSMVDPGLLEYADYKTVRARIFPIPAHGTKIVELEYTQLLKAEDGLLKYKFPLKAEGETTPSEEIKVDVAISDKQGVRSVWSPSHHISVTKDGTKSKIALLEKDTLPDKDFVLYYGVSDKSMSANLLTHKLPEEDGYFLLTLSPPQQPHQVGAKDIVLVADTSGSMAGEKIDQTRRALKYVINSLSSQDRFGLIQFNTDVEAFKLNLLTATPENKKSALEYVDTLEARGGTNISEALNLSKHMLAENVGHTSYLVLMTDGEPTVGETDAAKIVKSIAQDSKVRVFDFGVGYDVNTRFLNELAEEHHGTSQYVEPNENLETAVSSFYDKIKNPVLTDVTIDIDGVKTRDVYPKEVKDIFAGTQVMLLGKYKDGGKSVVRLAGTINGVKKAFSFNLNFQPQEGENSYLPRLWAMRRIGHLTEVAKQNGNNKEVVDEIVALSQKYGIISEYTSFLVTDPSEKHGSALPVPISAMRPVPMSVARMIGRPGGAGGASVAWNGPAMPQMQIADDRGVTRKEGVRGNLSAVRSESVDSAAMPMAKGLDMRRKDKQSNLAVAQSSGFRNFAFSSSPPAAPTGVGAVLAAKKADNLKNAIVANEESSYAGTWKSAGDKTFSLKESFWTENGLSASDLKSAKDVTFLSDEYFALIKKNPEIAKYLSVGPQVIVKCKGITYKILAPHQT
jgi:Ca-activated chloride channel family protein